MTMDTHYTQVPGEVVLFEDMRHRNALLYHYVVEGKESHLQALCDQWFNVRWQNRARIVPTHPYVLWTFVNSSCTLGACARQAWCGKPCLEPHCSQSMVHDPDGKAMGFFKFNMLVAHVFVQGPDGIPCLFSPYAFCDDGTVMATYRELFGWNVLLAELDFPTLVYGTAQHQFWFRCAMDVPRKVTYPGRPPLETFVELALPDGGASFLSSAQHHRGQQAMRQALVQHLSQCLQTRQGGQGTAIALELTQGILHDLHQVHLRQFRGTTSGERAILQAMQSVQMVQFQFHEGGILPTGQVMRFPPTCDTAQLHFPLQQDLGLPAEAEVVAACWTLVDFQHRPCRVSWSGVRQV